MRRPRFIRHGASCQDRVVVHAMCQASPWELSNGNACRPKCLAERIVAFRSPEHPCVTPLGVQCVRQDGSLRTTDYLPFRTARLSGMLKSLSNRRGSSLVNCDVPDLAGQI